MDEFKIVIFLMAILISLTAIVNKRKLPFPILLVAAGLVIGFVPQLPELALDPISFLLSFFHLFYTMQLLKLPGMNSEQRYDHICFSNYISFFYDCSCCNNSPLSYSGF
jgi:hypothetical protein